MTTPWFDSAGRRPGRHRIRRRRSDAPWTARQGRAVETFARSGHFPAIRAVEDDPSLERVPEVEESVGNSRRDEQKVSRLEGHRLVSHPEPSLALQDHVALVPGGCWGSVPTGA